MMQKLQSTFIIAIYKADRVTKYNLENDYQLLSGAGSILLATPDIVIHPVLNFSNGNCELLITECTQLKKVVVTVYRPPVPHFVLNLFVKY